MTVDDAASVSAAAARPPGSTSRPSWLAGEPTALILQPTTLCNLNCTYCYLPERRLKRDMTPAVAQAIARGIPGEWPSAGTLEIVWHGGEPLALGAAATRELFAPFEQLRTAGRIAHVVQTNATLITGEWCELFGEFGVSVGLSIDGPPEMSRNRVDWRGRPAFARIVDGIGELQRHGVDFTVITVVDQASTAHAAEILDFLAALGCPYVGINIEEKEGVNTHAGTPTGEQARRFWRDVFAWANANPGMQVREVEHLLEYLALSPAARATDVQHDSIPTIGWNGDVVLLSPELLGAHSNKYHDFIAGNVLTDTLTDIIDRAGELAYVREFGEGVRRCKASCDFFAHCQGAHAANRFFEHGTLLATETEHCRTSTQAVVLALHDIHSEGRLTG